jgi:asparagine N-glycosylation enzyme membrane subunit Stt3
LGGGLFTVSEARKPMLAAATLAGLLAGAAAGAASWAWPGRALLLALAAYLAGLLAVVPASRGGLSRILEAWLAYTALYFGFWVGVFNLFL